MKDFLLCRANVEQLNFLYLRYHCYKKSVVIQKSQFQPVGEFYHEDVVTRS